MSNTYKRLLVSILRKAGVIEAGPVVFIDPEEGYHAEETTQGHPTTGRLSAAARRPAPEAEHAGPEPRR
jgi:hypothetical protein